MGTSLRALGVGETASEHTAYDQSGNAVEHVSWNGQDQLATVGASGLPVAQTDSATAGGAAAITTSSVYNLDGALTHRDVVAQLGPTATPATAAYRYDAGYNQDDWLTISNDDGLRSGYGRDSLGRLTRLSYYIATPGPTSTRVPPASGSVTYGLDPAGLATVIKDSEVPAVGLGYDQDNRLVSESLPGGVAATATVDGAGRLIELRLSGPTASATPIGTATPTNLDGTYDYSYDPLGRTTQASAVVNGQTAAVASVTPDAAGRLGDATITDATHAGVASHWDYDPSGNLQDVKTGGSVAAQYSYDPNNPEQLTGLSGPGLPTLALSQYDANGNPGQLDGGAGQHAVALNYDARGRLASYVRADDGAGAQLTYNALGQRTGFTWHTAGTASYALRYQYRGTQLAQLVVVPSPTPMGTAVPAVIPPECNANDPQGCVDTFIYQQGGAPLELLYTPAKNGITQHYWYSLDGRGSVVALTDANGQVVDRYAYDLWGKPTTLSEQVPQPFLYAGYVYDRELADPGAATGWYWLSVRHYDPATGRFIQPDPSEREGTPSYVYCYCDECLSGNQAQLLPAARISGTVHPGYSGVARVSSTLKSGS